MQQDRRDLLLWRWDDRTMFDPAKGERWFCTENEALIAGWRAVRRRDLAT